MKAAFGGTIAIVLLGIYVHLIQTCYFIVDCVARVGCTSSKAADFNDVMAQSLTIIGGLVSALVIAELAVTKRGELPGARVFSGTTSRWVKGLLMVITVGYVLVWLFAGVVAFSKSMHHPTVLPPFTSMGQAWLGLAVAAAYAYLGLEQK